MIDLQPPEDAANLPPGPRLGATPTESRQWPGRGGWQARRGLNGYGRHENSVSVPVDVNGCLSVKTSTL